MAEYGLKTTLQAAAERAGRAGKFITLLLLFIVLTAAIAGVSAVLTGPDWGSLWVSLLLGLLVGWLLAILRWPALRAALVVIALTVLYGLLFAGGLNARLLAVVGELFRLSGQILATLRTRGIDFTQLNQLTLQVFSATGVVLGRVYTWISDLLTGKPTFDPVAASMVWSSAVWLVAAWAGWMVEAGRNALLAVLPALLLNLSTLSYGRSSSASIYLILGTTLVLIAVVQYGQREQEWSDTEVAYPRRKGREVGNTAAVLAILLVVLSAFLSSLSLQRILHWTSARSSASGQTENGLAKSLGIQPAITATPDAFSTQRSPGLPRELLIGAGPELSTEQVMSVQVTDLTALLTDGKLPPLYWRSFTYDIYTGHGWSTSTIQLSSYEADQPLQPDQLPGHQLAREMVSPVPGAGGVIYAAGEPVMMSVPGSAAWRSSNDLFGIQSSENGYEIQSLIPVVDENSLRQAGQAYPAWVVQRYLALPAEVPTRVRALAIQLTATEPTPYNRAHAIEQYLRQFPYTLDVPRPPANQDLADYFLFDLRKGYCDYYASAMVVMARAAGIPARLAIGYASGTYNLNSKRFIVTQADAHSWVEVYFPGTGWVPFEPTAGLPAINRAEQPTQVPAPPAAAPVVPARGVEIGKVKITLGWLIPGLVAALIFIWAMYAELRLGRLKPRAAAWEVYRRLRRYGAQLKVPVEGGETPYEFTASLGSRIRDITGGGTAAGVGASSLRDAEAIIHRIVRLSYRPMDADETSSVSMIRMWRSLRWRLRLLWVLQVWESMRYDWSQRMANQPEKGKPVSE